MLNLYEKNRDESYTRDTCFSQFIDFIKELSEGYKLNFAPLQGCGNKIVDNIFSTEWMLGDIEFILTMIDLNLNNPYKVQFSVPGTDTDPYPVISVKGFNRTQLLEFRKIIETYLVLLIGPNKIRPLNQSLARFCMEFVNEGDMIITFNYDLLIEQQLWKLGKWTPLDGYQIGSINRDDPNLQRVYDEISSKGIGKTKVILFKLHGSLNWDLYPNGNLEIRLTDHETGDCFFDSITAKGPCTGKPYEGKDELVGMPPSFIKVLPTKEFHELWDGALENIGKADEVYVIGYRLPEADIMAHLLIGKIAENCLVYLIKPSSDELRERILRNCGLEKVTALNYKFSDWVSANFTKS
jgi:hypothetical protein